MIDDMKTNVARIREMKDRLEAGGRAVMGDLLAITYVTSRIERMIETLDAFGTVAQNLRSDLPDSTVIELSMPCDAPFYEMSLGSFRAAAKFAGQPEVEPEVAYLASALDKSPDEIRRALDNLVERGLIEIVENKNA